MRLARRGEVGKCRKTWTALFLVNAVESVPEEPEAQGHQLLLFPASPSERLRLIQPVREAVDSSFPLHTRGPVKGWESSLIRGSSSGDVGIILVSGVMTAEYSTKSTQ